MNSVAPTTFAALQDRIEYLEAENHQLKQLLGEGEHVEFVDRARASLGLPPMPARMLAILANSKTHSRESLFHVLYADKLDAPETKILDIYLHRIRQALKPHGIEIETIWGQGYRLPSEHRAKVLSLLGLEQQT